MKVVFGVTFGKHAKDESPINPLVTLFFADCSKKNPSFGAAKAVNEIFKKSKSKVRQQTYREEESDR